MIFFSFWVAQRFIYSFSVSGPQWKGLKLKLFEVPGNLFSFIMQATLQTCCIQHICPVISLLIDLISLHNKKIQHLLTPEVVLPAPQKPLCNSQQQMCSEFKYYAYQASVENTRVQKYYIPFSRLNHFYADICVRISHSDSIIDISN